MKKLHLTAALLAAMAPGAALAQSADLNVIGTIVPTSCTPTFTGGTTVDLGAIPASTLNTTTQTTLTARPTELVVTCDAPAMIQLNVIDNRAATLNGAVTPPGIPGYERGFYNYGLGAIDGVNIGAFFMQLGTPTLDGVDAVFVQKQWSGGVWTQFYPYLSKGNVYTSAGAVATGPGSATVHTYPMGILPVITKGEDLPLANEIPIDGSITLEVTQI